MSLLAYPARNFTVTSPLQGYFSAVGPAFSQLSRNSRSRTQLFNTGSPFPQHAMALARVRGEGLRWPSAGFRRERLVFSGGPFHLKAENPHSSSRVNRCISEFKPALSVPNSIVADAAAALTSTQFSAMRGSVTVRSRMSRESERESSSDMTPVSDDNSVKLRVATKQEGSR